MLTRKAPLRRKAIKRTPRKAKSATDRRHADYVASLPCLVSGEYLVTIHHVTASIHGGRMARSERRIVPLAARYHLIQHGARESVEALGHGGFYRMHGVDLLAEAERLWLQSPANPDRENSC